MISRDRLQRIGEAGAKNALKCAEYIKQAFKTLHQFPTTPTDEALRAAIKCLETMIGDEPIPTLSVEEAALGGVEITFENEDADELDVALARAEIYLGEVHSSYSALEVVAGRQSARLVASILWGLLISLSAVK